MAKLAQIYAWKGEDWRQSNTFMRRNWWGVAILVIILYTIGAEILSGQKRKNTCFFLKLNYRKTGKNQPKRHRSLAVFVFCWAVFSAIVFFLSFGEHCVALLNDCQSPTKITTKQQKCGGFSRKYLWEWWLWLYGKSVMTVINGSTKLKLKHSHLSQKTKKQSNNQRFCPQTFVSICK